MHTRGVVGARKITAGVCVIEHSHGSESQRRTPDLSSRDIKLKLKYPTSLDASNNAAARHYGYHARTYVHLLALDIFQPSSPIDISKQWLADKTVRFPTCSVIKTSIPVLLKRLPHHPPLHPYALLWVNRLEQSRPQWVLPYGSALQIRFSYECFCTH